MPFDPKQLLDLAPLIMSAVHPGSPEAAAFMQGYQHARLQKHQQGLQDQQAARQDQLAQAQIQNLQADNQRADQMLALQRLNAYGTQDQRFQQQLEQKPETMLPEGTDPLQAQNALTVSRLHEQQRVGATGPQGPLPNMTQLVSEGKKRRAQKVIDQYEKQYAGQPPEVLDQMEHSFKMGAGEFQGMSIADIRNLTGDMIPPPAMKPKAPPAPKSLQAKEGMSGGKRIFANFDPGAGTYTDLQGNPLTDFTPLEPREPNPQRDRYNIQQVTLPDGSIGLIRVNMETGETSRVDLPQGTAGAGKPNASEQLGAGYLKRTTDSDVIAKGFEAQLAALGPQLDVQLPNLLKSGRGQRYKQAEAEFINAALRRESGAAIQPSEYTRFERIYFVMPGDTAETIAQKQAARQRVIDGFKVGSGNLGNTDLFKEPSGDQSDPALQILEQRRQNRR